MIPYSDLNYGFDSEIVEVILAPTLTDEDPVYMVWNNITKQYINNGQKFTSYATARSAARHVLSLYSGCYNLVEG